MEKNLTQGSIKKHYFRYLGAAFGGSMISCIYGLVDVAVVGQYQGPQGTAALSIVAPIWTILYSLGILTGSGCSFSEICILCLDLTWVCLEQALRLLLA